MITRQRICILRLSALGDVCNTVPLVRAVQQTCPAARITWVIDRSCIALVEDLPDVEFVPLDKRTGWQAFTRLRRAVGNSPFDILLHAQVSARANVLAMAIRARRRVGWDRARAREGHGLVIGERIRAVPMQHQLPGLLEFSRHLGAADDMPDRRLPMRDEDRAFARLHLPQAQHAVLISPCSSHPLRNWSAQRYAAVADWVIHETGRPVVLIGGPATIERQTAHEIESAMRGQPLNLVGQDTLKQLPGLLERAALLIAPDSGPVHIAAAMGTPVVGLYAATWSKRSGPWGSLEHCVDRFAQAAQRYRKCEPEALRWGARIERPGVMDLIAVADVTARLETLLS